MPTITSEWDRCAPWIQAAIDADPIGMPIEQVRAEIEANRAKLWPSPNAAAVAGFLLPLGVIEYHVWLAGGDLAELQSMYRQARTYAAANGAARFYVWGRKGWRRALAGDFSAPPAIFEELP